MVDERPHERWWAPSPDPAHPAGTRSDRRPWDPAAPSARTATWSGFDGRPETWRAPADPWARPGPARERRRSRRGRGLVAAGIVGGLVGGLVVGLVLAVLAPVERTEPATVIRPSEVIDGGPTDLAAILADVEPAVVRIDVGGAGRSGSGTGFITSEDGTIVTNAHVIGDSSSIQVTLAGGDVASASLVGSDPTTDVAIIEIDRTGLPTVRLGSSEALQVGDDVVAIGHALGLAGRPSVTTGVVSALNRSIGTERGGQLDDVIQTDAAINPGNSGGPLVNARGEVVGINTAIADPRLANNIGFAIAIDAARPIAEEIRELGPPAYLGVRTQEVTPGLAAARGLATGAGALVEEVVPGTPADAAGLVVDDVIVEIDGTRVERNEQVREAVRRNRPGDRIELVVDRAGERVRLEVELATVPPGGF